MRGAGGRSLKKKAGALLAVWLCLFFSLPATAQDASHTPRISFSWWGDASQSETIREAAKIFVKSNKTPIKSTAFQSRSSYMKKLSARLDEGTAASVVLLDEEMLRTLARDEKGQLRFLDMETLTGTIDLTQFSFLGLQGCTVDGQLCAVPVGMTAHVFMWDQSALKRAGFAIPKTTEELLEASETRYQQEGTYLLGTDAVGRMALLVTYLQSEYGLSWVNPETGRSDFSAEQVAEGMRYLRRLEAAYVLAPYDEGEHLMASFRAGRYAGIWIWDSEAGRAAAALNGRKLVFASHLTDWGPYDGGFEKVQCMLAIPETTTEFKTAASLIQFLLNSEAGARALGDVWGIPDSKSGVKFASKTLDQNRRQASQEALSWPRNSMPMAFEAAAFTEPDGVYRQVLFGLSQGKLTPEAAAVAVLSGLKSMLGETGK